MNFLYSGLQTKQFGSISERNDDIPSFDQVVTALPLGPTVKCYKLITEITKSSLQKMLQLNLRSIDKNDSVTAIQHSTNKTNSVTSP